MILRLPDAHLLISKNEGAKAGRRRITLDEFAPKRFHTGSPQSGRRAALA
ncbi:hypothetical protein [Burkholderia ubonensis]|nr:hypothetical protein [Burkholderia ubonensis]